MSQVLTLSPWLQTASATFMTTLTGLAFETVPFLLLGTFISSLIHVFIPDTMLRRLFPKNRILSILVALVAGAFVPICECGTVPLARRLREKGLPLSTAAAFLVAAPLANPMTIVSTYVAFNGGPYPMYLLRLGFGLGAALLIALIVELISSKDSEPLGAAAEPRFRLRGTTVIWRSRLAVMPVRLNRSLWARSADVLDHTSYDFLDSARYLIIGISAAAFVRALLPANAVTSSLRHPLGAIGVGSLSAYTLSLCSSADAFVARSLFAPASYPAALVFLMLGPMIDLKNSILLARFLRPRRLAAFIAIIVAVCALVALVASLLIGGFS